MYSNNVRVTNPISNVSRHDRSGKFTRTAKVIEFNEHGNKIIHKRVHVKHITISGAKKTGMFNGKHVKYVNGENNVWVTMP